MAAALAAAAVEHELVMVPGAGHAFDYEPERPDVAAAMARVQSFLRRHL
jgi:acetyl esterase/lipase